MSKRNLDSKSVHHNNMVKEISYNKNDNLSFVFSVIFFGSVEEVWLFLIFLSTCI